MATEAVSLAIKLTTTCVTASAFLEYQNDRPEEDSKTFHVDQESPMGPPWIGRRHKTKTFKSPGCEASPALILPMINQSHLLHSSLLWTTVLLSNVHGVHVPQVDSISGIPTESLRLPEGNLDVDETLFTKEQHESFQKDGFLVISGLLDGEIDDFVKAGDAFVAQSKKLKAYFSQLEMGVIFRAGSTMNNTITRSFRRIALESVIPRAAAELMNLSDSQSVRVLR